MAVQAAALEAAFLEATARAAFFSGRASALAEVREQLGGQKVEAAGGQAKSGALVFGFARALKEGV